MATDVVSPNQRPVPDRGPADPSAHEATTGSYLDWPAVLAGGLFALALAFLLVSFGASLGLSLTSPYRGEGVSAGWLAIAAGIWFAWVTVTSFGAGGYLTGRMRRRAGDATATEVEARDGAHGLMVWAAGVVVGSVLAAMGVGGLIGIGASAVGSASELATEAVEAADSEYFANVMLRGMDASDQAGTAADAETTDGTPAATESETADGQTAADPTPAAQSIQSPEQTATLEAIDPAVQQQVATIIARSAASGEMAERDRSYLSQLVAANTGLDPTEAQARVDEVTAELDAVRAEALAAAEEARVVGVVFGFIAAATLLIGAIAAFFAATAGGHHRDEGLGFDVLMKRL